MRGSEAAVAALFIWTVATPALAASAPEDLVKICLDPGGDATARARAEGYVTAPPEIAVKAKELPGAGSEILWRAAEGAMLLFVGTSMTRDVPDSPSVTMSGDVCLVASMPQDADAKAAVERLLNVGPEQPVGKSNGYVFEQTANGRVRLDVTDRALMGVKALQGAVRIVGVLERPNATALMVMAPRIATK